MANMLKFVNGNMVEYTIYKLVDCYDPILRQPTKTVEFGKDNATFMAFSLAETLSKIGGLGLSANQVGVPYKLCAINVGTHIWVMINPEITYASEELSDFKEGCLSFPGLYLKIRRPSKIRVKFNAIGGEEVEQEFDGLTATVIQHELDHLNGICYTDLVSDVILQREKRKVKANLKKMKRDVDLKGGNV